MLSGMLLSVTADEYAYAIAGQRITLPCPGVNTNSNPGTVSWKHNGTKVLRYIEGKPWQGKSELYHSTRFLKAPDEEIFAAVNSTVTLSYVFNFNPQDEKYNTVKVHQTQETSGKPTSPNGSGTCSERKIPKVQFEDAGQYQCHIGLGHRPLNKTTHLVVMKVFANHTGPLLEDDRISLCCIISAPLPPRAVLRWDAANASTDVPHCLVIRTAGLRTCSLIVAGEVKINMSYAVEAAVGQIQFPPTNVVLGAGVPFVLLILLSVCLFVYIAIKRKKQRVERMIQAKQHLLAKRTCQCQREQSNDYYHT
uniref:uncharacterized protein LOC130476478 n=1 Tax=Euleptes europaea TaxID=460621 RepID=UPI0025407E0C|nr:uncharacterized protein LOC130476478 [Euleptes europaea]